MTRAGVRERHIRDLARAGMAPCNTNQTTIEKPRRACLLLLDVANVGEATRGDCNCVMAGFVPAIDDFAHFSNDGWMPATNSGIRRDRGP